MKWRLKDAKPPRMPDAKWRFFLLNFLQKVHIIVLVVTVNGRRSILKYDLTKMKEAFLLVGPFFESWWVFLGGCFTCPCPPPFWFALPPWPGSNGKAELIVACFLLETVFVSRWIVTHRQKARCFEMVSVQGPNINTYRPWKLTHPLKIDGWKMTFPFKMIPFQGTCQFSGGYPEYTPFLCTSLWLQLCTKSVGLMEKRNIRVQGPKLYNPSYNLEPSFFSRVFSFWDFEDLQKVLFGTSIMGILPWAMKDVVSIVFQGRIWEHLWVTSTKAAFFWTKLLKGAYLESRWCPILKAKVAGFGVKLPKEIGHLAFQVVDCFHQKELSGLSGWWQLKYFWNFHPNYLGKLFPLFDVRIFFQMGLFFFHHQF